MIQISQNMYQYLLKVSFDATQPHITRLTTRCGALYTKSAETSRCGQVVSPLLSFAAESGTNQQQPVRIIRGDAGYAEANQAAHFGGVVDGPGNYLQTIRAGLCQQRRRGEFVQAAVDFGPEAQLGEMLVEGYFVFDQQAQW